MGGRVEKDWISWGVGARKRVGRAGGWAVEAVVEGRVDDDDDDMRRWGGDRMVIGF